MLRWCKQKHAHMNEAPTYHKGKDEILYREFCVPHFDGNHAKYEHDHYKFCSVAGANKTRKGG